MTLREFVAGTTIAVFALGLIAFEEAGDFWPPVAAGAPDPGRSLRITGDRHGLFVTDCRISNIALHCGVDTGATDTTLDRSAAERVGINLAQLRFTLQVHTANGVVPGAKTRIATLRVGPFSLNDVPVTVIDADMDGDPMLGMAFLRKYKLSIGNDQLTISE